jgi:hypothetical protein
MLDDHKRKLEKEIDGLKMQINQASNTLNHTLQNEKLAISYLDWFSKLEKNLHDVYGISIRDDIENFAHLINDFKDHGYDATEIINEYLKSLSLKLTINTDETKLEEIRGQIASLQSSYSYWESQVQTHKQAMDVYNELTGMNFGLYELKQIWYAILEISEFKNTSTGEAVSKFMEDIGEQYLNSLLFEDKVNKKRKELALLTNEIDNKHLMLQLIPFIGTALQNLFQNGVGVDGIIGINRLAQEYRNNGFPTDAAVVIEGEDNKGKEKKEPEAATRLDFWKSLTDELKTYGGIKLAIKKQSETLAVINQEIGNSNEQKKDLLAYCHLAFYLMNTINNNISYLKGLVDSFNSEPCIKYVQFCYLTQSPLFLFVMCGNSENKGQGGRQLKGKKPSARLNCESTTNIVSIVHPGLKPQPATGQSLFILLKKGSL